MRFESAIVGLISIPLERAAELGMLLGETPQEFHALISTDYNYLTTYVEEGESYVFYSNISSS